MRKHKKKHNNKLPLIIQYPTYNVMPPELNKQDIPNQQVDYNNDKASIALPIYDNNKEQNEGNIPIYDNNKE
jgi:hypothetical protein